jgi:hypothetical protein
MRVVGLSVCLVLVSPGCINQSDASPMVRTQAQADLGCPSKQILVKRLVGGRYRASGCGKSALYYGVCEGLRCGVSAEGEDPQPWRDRPDPFSVGDGR